MKELEQKIKQEIIDIHDLFVEWFTGKSDEAALKDKLAPRFYKETHFITTKGQAVTFEGLMRMFKEGYGRMDPDFKIVISNIEILQEVGEYVLATYVEWQTDDPNPEASGNYNARKTTIVISNQAPFKWLHIHETMLPKPDRVIENWRLQTFD